MDENELHSQIRDKRDTLMDIFREADGSLQSNVEKYHKKIVLTSEYGLPFFNFIVGTFYGAMQDNAGTEVIADVPILVAVPVINTIIQKFSYSNVHDIFNSYKTSGKDTLEYKIEDGLARGDLELIKSTEKKEYIRSKSLSEFPKNGIGFFAGYALGRLLSRMI